MNRYKLYIVAATIALFAQNGHSEKSKLKIPHNHAPMEGGSVVMLARSGQARAAALRIASQYQAQSGHQPTILVPG